MSTKNEDIFEEVEDIEFGSFVIDDVESEEVVAEEAEAETVETPEEEETETIEEKPEEEIEEEVIEKEVENNDDKLEESVTEGYSLTPYYEYLMENNMLMVDEEFEFDGTEEALELAVQQDQSNRNSAIANAMLSKLPKNVQDFFSYALAGGTDLTKLIEKEEEVQDITSTDLEDSESVRNLLIADFEARGIPKEAIAATLEVYGEEEGREKKEAEAIIQKAKDAKALAYQTSLKEIEDSNKKIAKENEVKAKAITDRIEASKFRKNRKEIITSQIFSKEGESPIISKFKTIINTDPENLVMLADMLSYYDSEKKSWDLTKFRRSVESKITRKTKSSLTQKLKTDAGHRRNQGNNKVEELDLTDGWEIG